MAHKWVRLMGKPLTNPSNPTRRGKAKGTVNSIVAKINSTASYGRKDRDLLTIER